MQKQNKNKQTKKKTFWTVNYNNSGVMYGLYYQYHLRVTA